MPIDQSLANGTNSVQIEPILCQLNQSIADEKVLQGVPVFIVQDSSQVRLIGRFPLLKGNSRLTESEMNWYNLTANWPILCQLDNPSSGLIYQST